MVTVADLLPGGSPPPLTLPSNLTAPSISGTASQGSTLTRTAGSWSGNPVPSVTADWQRNGVSTGQSGISYNLTLADVGETITVVETATNSQGSATATSNSIGPISGTLTAPSNTTPASISGTAQVGSTLTAVAGSWSGNPTPSVSGQWRRGGVAISGATALTYVLVSADQGQTIDYYETATNSQGTAYQPSNSLGPVTASGGGGILSAPTLDYPTTANPPTLGIHIGADWITGDILKLQIDTDLAFTTPAPTLLTHTIVDADTVPGATITMTIPTLTGVNYFRAYGNDGTADSTFKSNTVAWGDSTAPSITNSGTVSITETSQLAVALTTSEAIASAQIAGGADQLQFEVVNVSGTWTLRWINNGSQSYATPLDLGGDNVYNVDVTATDYGGNVSAIKSFAVTVTQIDRTPNAFTFTDVSNATPSTLYTSNTVTIAGLEPGFNIASSVSGTGAEYQKNGGAWTPAGSFTMQNGDTLAVRNTSSASYATPFNVVATVGTYSDTYTVTTENNPSAAGFTVPASQPAVQTGLSGSSATFSVAFDAGYPVVGVPYNSGRNVSSITVNGVALTARTPGGTGNGIWTWPNGTAAIAAGTYNVVVTWSGAVTSAAIMAGTIVASTNDVPLATATSSLTSANTKGTTSALTIPSAGIGVAFLEQESTTNSPTATTGTLIASGMLGLHGAGVYAGAFSVDTVAGDSWTPTFSIGGSPFNMRPTGLTFNAT